MKIIKFYSKYSSLIKTNTKTQTIRLWQKCTLTVNEIITLDCGVYTFQAKIVSVEQKLYSDLTDETALFDGFKCKEDLKMALQRTYKNIHANSNVFVIQWVLQDITPRCCDSV